MVNEIHWTLDWTDMLLSYLIHFATEDINGGLVVDVAAYLESQHYVVRARKQDCLARCLGGVSCLMPLA